MTYNLNVTMTEYQKFVIKIIRSYKNNYLSDINAYSITLRYKARVVGRLRPIPVQLIGECANDIVLQTNWRNIHKDTFLVDPFHATEERTSKWIDETYVRNDDRIIFMILDHDNFPIGHLSFENFIYEEKKCEYGRLMRGDISKHEKKGRYNLIEIAQIAFLNWGFKCLDLKSVYGTQFRDNIPVNILHGKCGFRTIKEYEYKKSKGTVTLAEVVLEKENFKFLDLNQ
jgi:RimJ/RimL family protein N-acetyltransferase